MPAPWAEHAQKVVVEFTKSSGGVGRREIKLSHSAAAVPPQLNGRVSPETWSSFMTDMERLAAAHPYVVPPSAGRMCGWLGGAVMAAAIGICCLNPDGGDYAEWLPQVEGALAQWRAPFEAGGAHLSLQRAQGSYWVQIDVDPSLAIGQPVPAKAT